MGKPVTQDETDRVVYVVDDDDIIRSGIAKLLLAEGYTVRTFDSAEAFLAQGMSDPIACIVLDVQMPGLSGLELQEHLLEAGRELAIVFVTAHGGIPDSVRAIKHGAVDFLSKPFDPTALLDSVAQAIKEGERLATQRAATDRIDARVERLTRREHEVMRHVLTGALNKQIAAALGISEKTVKIHRGRVMTKMEVTSVADLVRDTQRVGITPAEPTNV